MILERIIDLKSETLKKYPRDGVTPENVNVDSPVPFSLNKLWHSLYSTEFGTYYNAKGNASAPRTWAYEKDGAGTEIKGDAQTGIPPKFRKVKNIKDDDEKINYIPDGYNLRGPVENLGTKIRVSRFDFHLKVGEWHPDVDGNVTKEIGRAHV